MEPKRAASTLKHRSALMDGDAMHENIGSRGEITRKGQRPCSPVRKGKRLHHRTSPYVAASFAP
jgi:hypothetical protein